MSTGTCFNFHFEKITGAKKLAGLFLSFLGKALWRLAQIGYIFKTDGITKSTKRSFLE
jgi:hypothetical protein